MTLVGVAGWLAAAAFRDQTRRYSATVTSMVGYTTNLNPKGTEPMTATTLPCKCGYYPGMGRHEPHCPIALGYDWCDDCGQRSCVCRRPAPARETTAGRDPWAPQCPHCREPHDPESCRDALGGDRDE